jgi:hypothetical protein
MKEIHLYINNIIKNLACDELIMKFVQILFIHRFIYFTNEYHALKTHLTHG